MAVGWTIIKYLEGCHVENVATICVFPIVPEVRPEVMDSGYEKGEVAKY